MRQEESMKARNVSFRLLRISVFPVILGGVVGLGTLAVASPARAADSYPSRPIRLVCPFPPGGGLDFVARTLGEKLAGRWGQPVVIDNRPGASGLIGAGIVARAAPDGYTVLVASSSTLAASPALRRQSYEETMKDFAPVSLLSRIPYVLVVHPSVPVKSVAELIQYAKSQPGRINYASSGTGSASHLAMELFKSMAGVDLTHVPYKGSSPAAVGLIGGQVQAGFSNLVPALPHLKSGRLRALGVSGPARSAVMPDVPTIAETGLPGYEALQWYGVLLPSGTLRPILTRLHQEIVAILQLPDVRARLMNEGGEVIGSTPEELARHIKSEIAKWTRVVNAANIRAN